MCSVDGCTRGSCFRPWETTGCRWSLWQQIVQMQWIQCGYHVYSGIPHTHISLIYNIYIWMPIKNNKAGWWFSFFNPPIRRTKVFCVNPNDLRGSAMECSHLRVHIHRLSVMQSNNISSTCSWNCSYDPSLLNGRDDLLDDEGTMSRLWSFSPMINLSEKCEDVWNNSPKQFQHSWMSNRWWEVHGRIQHWRTFRLKAQIEINDVGLNLAPRFVFTSIFREGILETPQGKATG